MMATPVSTIPTQMLMQVGHASSTLRPCAPCLEVEKRVCHVHRREDSHRHHQPVRGAKQLVVARAHGRQRRRNDWQQQQPHHPPRPVVKPAA